MDPAALSPLLRWLRSGRPPDCDGEAEAAALVDAAAAQRVAPLLYVAVGAATDWPEAGRARLRQLHHAAFAAGARQLDLARSVLDALERAGVRALPMKGAALAEWAYDSVADRPMGDVDVLVLDAWPRAVEAVRSAGLAAGARADHAWTFADADDRSLELHHAVTSCPGLFPLNREGLWARSVASAGQVPRRPAAEDLLVQLALHAAFQHALVMRLNQYLDFKRVLAREAVDLIRVRDVALESGAGAALGASLAVADALVGVPAPELLAWSRSLLPRGLARWLDARLSDPAWFLPPQAPPTLRLRWALAAGRRRSLVSGTLAPLAPGAGGSGVQRARSAVARTLGLARRWL